ncbi:hypothetical protein M011DRAFT_222976 [Sporormia fimetaria CBS 119925]|uniref:Uncharacterized protein n=1 Tax=Sporormia fimetaria CBS 119925 TaxID=1340428 RepID=A0A6A6V0M7_9PLEO|nr:hypothetical protein M011DRAFT_222976 [Sporormia fimetaria CBS 119925]
MQFAHDHSHGISKQLLSSNHHHTPVAPTQISHAHDQRRTARINRSPGFRTRIRTTTRTTHPSTTHTPETNNYFGLPLPAGLRTTTRTIHLPTDHSLGSNIHSRIRLPAGHQTTTHTTHPPIHHTSQTDTPSNTSLNQTSNIKTTLPRPLPRAPPPMSSLQQDPRSPRVAGTYAICTLG